METNHKEANELACHQFGKSNLARSYLDIRALLDVVWHCQNDDAPPDFPMRDIERVLSITVAPPGAGH